MSLSTYQKKRDFQQTTEPKGQYDPATAGHNYLIQKHEARRLHYDFRLQVGGVLKSWAVPKGPSLDPKDKRLAVETEDHPLDYGDFEGTIPPDNYGAGTVMLWDKGEWEPVGDLEQGLKKGKLSFELHGERLHGRWALIKMRGRKKSSGNSGKEWLLVKEDDTFADAEVDPTQEFTDSVVSHRSMDAIAQERKSVTAGELTTGEPTESHGGKNNRKRSSEQASAQTRNRSESGKSQANSKSERTVDRKKWSIDRKLSQLQDPDAAHELGEDKATSQRAKQLASLAHAKKASFPWEMKPQLASLYQEAPASDEWLHEIKYDGYRLLAMSDDRVRLMTRNGKDWTEKFSGIAEALQSLPQAIVDGELVYVDENGISNFEALQTVLQNGDTSRLVFYAFDLPYLEGYDLTKAPLVERKALLAQVIHEVDDSRLVFSDHFEGGGPEVISHACAHGLEGIVSKQAQSPYETKRTKTWRKVKCGKRQEFVVVGFTPPKGSRQGFGSLLLGYYEGEKLRYAGKVGTGFNQQQLGDIHGQLKRFTQKAPALDEDVAEAEVSWVKPEMVAEVEFTEWTSGNRLRHPSFIDLRSDKPARDIVREVPRDQPRPQPANKAKPAGKSKGASKRSGAAVKVAGVAISHPDKMLYAQSEITKGDLAEYYAAIADYILPHIEKRPLTLVRCPQGHTKNCFFQKHLHDTFDPAVKPIAITEKKGESHYAYVDSVQGLMGLVQMGTLEIHAWGSRIDDPDKPDMLVFDLDPDEGVSWEQVKSGVRETRDFLAELGLQSFLRTSGGKGLHVVVPVSRRHTWDEAKAFCKAVAQRMADQQPERYIATASKAKRKNKIFIDYLRNGRGATSICSYSTRSRSGAPVATPLEWSELESLSSSQVYRLDNILERVHALKVDPWEGYSQVRQSITQKIKSKLGMV